VSSADDDDRRRPQRMQHFATFPLIRWTPTLTAASTTAADEPSLRHQRHDDVITTLMITHSGEPISVGLNHQENVPLDRPLSVPVTVPEPTSFHQDGSQIRQQLLDHHRSTTSVQRPRHEYEKRCRRSRRRRHRRRRAGLQQTAIESTTSDSEITAASRNWRLSPSPVFHLLHHHHQASYCVNSTNKDTERLQLNSPSLLIDSSVADTDSPSFCQVRYISDSRTVL